MTSANLRADLMALLAIVVALVAVSLAWRGNVLGAVVTAINGVTVALVALGWWVTGP